MTFEYGISHPLLLSLDITRTPAARETTSDYFGSYRLEALRTSRHLHSWDEHLCQLRGNLKTLAFPLPNILHSLIQKQCQ